MSEDRLEAQVHALPFWIVAGQSFGEAAQQRQGLTVGASPRGEPIARQIRAEATCFRRMATASSLKA
jgi:hypothetical protein